MSKQPNWARLDRQRLQKMQSEYDSQVREEELIRTMPLSDLRANLCTAYRQLDDPLFDRCLEHLPAVPASAICYFADGDKRCCVFGDFRNMMVDPCGFGDTDAKAYADLKQQRESEGEDELD